MSSLNPPQAPKKAKKRAEGASSNVFSMFEQAQIQEFKEVGTLPKAFFHIEFEQFTDCDVCSLCILPQAFTIMDQNRDGFIDKNDLRDTFAALGKLTVCHVPVVMVSHEYITQVQQKTKETLGILRFQLLTCKNFIVSANRTHLEFWDV